MRIHMKNMTIRQLKTFESVARNLSFSRAAEDLHLTQPAVSMQIKQMEDQAGLPLFRHIGKRISLTEAGELILNSSVPRQSRPASFGIHLQAAEIAFHPRREMSC